MKWAAYPRYKPSGVEWLGKISESWKVSPLGYMVRFRGGATPDKSRSDFWDGAIPWVSPKDMKRPQIEDSEDHISEEGYRRSSLSMVPVNAVLVVVRGMILAHSFPTALTAVPVTLNQDMKALLADRPLAARYLFWTLTGLASVLVSLADESAHGTRKIETPTLAKLPVPTPPLDEQNAIADFLDEQTARVDALVAKKRTLIERLKEKRTALISQTVTRGLPPEAAHAAGLDRHPKLKPSGVDWLGDVPEHWEIRRLGHVARVVRGASPRPAGDSRFFDGDFMPWITVAEITRDNKRLLSGTDSRLTEAGARSSRLFNKGTLVLSNSGATLGVPKILDLSGCANDGVVGFERLDAGTDKLFLHYYLSSLTENLRDRMRQGSGQPNLNTDLVKGLYLPVPPLSEQRLIVEYLDQKVEKVDALTSKVEAAIERLQEYRTALITAAVTGKIDVRRAGAKIAAEV